MTDTENLRRIAETIRQAPGLEPLADAIVEAADDIERLTAALTGIAVMDVYTRPGEQPASEVMRNCAKAALNIHKRGEI